MAKKGMSDKTAKGYGYSERGIPASERAASEDFCRLKEFDHCFVQAAQQTGMDKYTLAGIASRESRAGNALDKNGLGDNGNGYGIMQIDKRSHSIDTSGGPASCANILQGAMILQQNTTTIKKQHPNWNEGRQHQGAIAAYNFGPKNVRTPDGIDRGTTGGDYSSDVMARAEHLKKKGL